MNNGHKLNTNSPSSYTAICTGCLVLTPEVSSQATLELDLVLSYLQKSKFIGPPLEINSACGAFLVGEAFLQIITFMGCSPQLNLAPSPHGEPFCYIRIEGPWPKPQLRRSSTTQGPRCRVCRGRIVSWKEHIEEWLAKPTDIFVACLRCGQKQRPVDFSWRQDAAFGQLFVYVENVFPGEAAPVPAFLVELQRVTKTTWHYFYLKDLVD